MTGPPGGYAGKALIVDVTGPDATVLPLDDAVLRAYLGGVGLGAWLLHRLAPPHVDPCSAQAPLVFVFSPLVGTPLTTSAKFAVVAKSPLTDRIGDALSSDRFAIELKKAGMDALVLVGRAEHPVAVVVDDGAVRIEDARALWGLPAKDAEAAL
ncbi:MAG: aldehyde ferredoxin oxidoreductase N-terminal domain-containing protein, partial [Pseudonocardiaceae bacterium]